MATLVQDNKLATADPASIAVETQPLVFGVGVRPEVIPAPRPDLAGVRAKSPASPAIFLIDPEGYLRWIPNPSTYNNLFRNWNGVVVSLDLNTIARGADLSDGAVLAKGGNTAPIYLLSNGIKRWITSPAVMDKYYFNWSTVVSIPQAAIDAIPTGGNWS